MGSFEAVYSSKKIRVAAVKVGESTRIITVRTLNQIYANKLRVSGQCMFYRLNVQHTFWRR